MTSVFSSIRWIAIQGLLLSIQWIVIQGLLLSIQWIVIQGLLLSELFQWIAIQGLLLTELFPWGYDRIDLLPLVQLRLLQSCAEEIGRYMIFVQINYQFQDHRQSTHTNRSGFMEMFCHYIWDFHITSHRNTLLANHRFEPVKDLNRIPLTKT